MSVSRLGKPRSEETKKKMSRSNIGKTLSEGHKQKLSKAHAGKTLSKEHKQKIKEANVGRTHTKESKQQMSGVNNQNSKIVYQYDMNYNLIASFASSGEAARALGKQDGAFIRNCAIGNTKNAYGFKWSRENLH
jgi:group I intron endonuclease